MLRRKFISSGMLLAISSVSAPRLCLAGIRESYTVRLLQADGSEGESITFQPFSAEAVLGTIASLGGAYLGGKNLKLLFEKQSDEIKLLIERAVNRMVSLINAKIDENSIRRIQAQINACRDLLVEFENSPRIETRLTDAISSSMAAVLELSAFGWRQFEAFGDAVSIRVLALCVSTKHYRLKGELISLKEYIDISLVRLKDQIEDARIYYTSLINNITDIGISNMRYHSGGCGREYPCDPYFDCKAYFSDNGEDINVNDVWGSSEAEAAANARAKLIPIREARLKARRNMLDHVIQELQKGYEIRQAEWRKCILLAEKIKFKD
ncbi:MAG: hypothetical protein OEW48_19915 [Phycisphaerae bacterium]|nr:hypothetical protein [Phycisphaerae bacterium]